MKHKLKICVYAICKNEVDFVDRWIDSMSEADMIVVTDTGSSDGTVEKLRERGAIVHINEVKPWRFDVARNISLDNVPKDVDICVCTDLDELFVEGWREKIEKAWLQSIKKEKGNVRRQGKYLYNWSIKPDGTPDVQFTYFKIHEREGFRWKCPIHEYLHYIGKEKLEIIYMFDIVLNHYPDNSKSRGSYLPLLEMDVDEDPNDSRMRYYLGREYMFVKDWDKCIKTLEHYLKMNKAVWDDERCAAMRWIGKAYSEMFDYLNSYAWFVRAIAEQPKMREPYVEMARVAYNIGDWSVVYLCATEALKISEKSKTFVNTGYSWDSTPNDLSSIAAYKLGLYKEAYTHAILALEYDPSDERILNNIELIKQNYKS